MSPHYSLIRRRELWLAFLALLITLAGIGVITIAEHRATRFHVDEFTSGFIIGGLVIAASLFWSLVRFRGDELIFPLVALLSIIGYLLLLRLQPDLTRLDQANSNLALRQLLYIAAGILEMLVVARCFRHWHLIRRYRYSLLLICIGLLIVTFVLGTSINGARLWITIGPIQVQPSEVVKIGLVLFLAAYLEENRELIGASWRVGPLRLPPIPYLLPMALMWATSLLVLVVENDLGSALLLFGIFLIMIYVGTGRPFYVLAGLVSFAAACWLAYLLFHRIGIRVNNWLDPWWDPLGAGYQQIQSDYSIANGGLLGVGLAAGQPWRVPIVQTDYIFSAFAEETGLTGTFALLSIYGLLIARGLHVAIRARDRFLRLVAIGLSGSLAIQTAVIIGGVVRLIPLTGITLPFVSYGGSSMLTNYLIIALLLNISAQPTRIRP